MDFSISVVVPVFNVEKYLNRCVDSLISQTYKPNEIILVDDGSTDRSPIICDQYEAKIDHIHVIHQENMGLAGAKNTGIEACKSDCVVFIDSDDYVEPDLIKHLIDAKQRLDADIICEPLIYEYPNGTQKSMLQFNDLVLDVDKAQGCILRSKYSGVTSCAKLFPVSTLRAVNFPKGKINEDLRSTIPQIGTVNKIGFICKADYHYIQRRGSIIYGGQNYESVIDAISVCEKYQNETDSTCVKKGAAVRVYMIVAGYAKSTKKIPSRLIKDLQKKIKKQDKYFYSDDENTLIDKIKYFLVSRCVLTFKLYSLLQQAQMRLEAGNF